MSRISSCVGSYNLPDAAALAKQIGHFKLHLLVTSINPNTVEVSWFSQSPQSFGQPKEP